MPGASRQSPQPVRFAVIGDFGKAGPDLASVATQIKSWNPDFVVTTGDNNYELGEASTIDVNIGQYFHEFIGPYSGSYGAGSTVNRFFPSLGNHDWGDGFIFPSTVKPYTDYFTLPGNERYYQIVQGPVQLFALDSDGFEPDGTTSSSVQGAWLQNALAASSSPWKIVFFHHPPYSSSSHLSGITEERMRWPFAEWGASAVLAGHHHTYERLLRQNLPYFITGLGGNGKDTFTFPLTESQARYTADYGAMLVTATNARIVFQFVTRTGSIVDEYAIDAPAGPGAPYNLVATPVPTGRVDLWWTDQSANEQYFSLERSQDGVTFEEIAILDPNVSTYVDTAVNVTPTQYFYRVRAQLLEGPSAYSNLATATTVPSLPPSPTNITATSLSSSAIGLSWNSMPDVLGYRVYRLSGPTFSVIAALAANITSYTDGARAPSTQYSYVVRAFNSAGESPSTQTVSAMTSPQMPAPTGLVAAAASSSQIDLTWTDNSTGEDGFKVLRSTDGVNFGTLGWTGPNTTTFSNTGRPPLTKYYYRVQAYEATGGLSPLSNISSATTLPLIAAPSGLTATTISTSRIDLAWTDNSTTETNFRIYSSTDGVTFTFRSQVGANISTLASTGLTAGTTYYYRVTAREAGGGESEMSNTASATTVGLPLAPSGLVATAVSSSQINLTWTDNSTNEGGFRIDRSNDGVTFGTLGWANANATTFANTGRPPGTTYYYRVVSYNNDGYSPPSNVASATTLTPLAAPSNLSATAKSSTRIDFSWTDNSSGEAGYRVYRSTDGASFSLLASLGANVTTYTSGSFAGGTTYYFYVVAYESGGGVSGPSNTATATTVALPVAPTNLAATALSSTQIQMTWTDNSNDETHFRVDVSTNGVSFSTLTWISANITTFTHGNRAPGTTYYYRVSAYNANGTSAPSNVASATTLP